MNNLRQTTLVIFVCLSLLLAAACNTTRDGSGAPVASPTATPTPTPTPTPVALNEAPMTLPLLDAFFFSDERFATDLANNLRLTDDQIVRLRSIAREETARLRESRDGNQAEYEGSTKAAAELATRRLTEILGDEKAYQLSDFVLRRWREGNDDVAVAPSPLPTSSATPLATATPITTGTLAPPASPSPLASPVPAAPPVSPRGTSRLSAIAARTAPLDTRVVVNAPAHRMDVFENGRLIKSYKIGIGYPEFPLPTGERRATSLIFNPTWTPPDEPWVESSKEVKVGQKVEAGSKLNPLGVMKIPIGLPSLIHGGKAPAQLGRFASHGCVGLTDKQVQDFAKILASLGGGGLTDQQIAANLKTRTETENVKLGAPIPVELRYETIVVEDGKLRIYRDVYERGTNTMENLQAVLAAYNLTLDQLSSEERAQVEQALQQMSRGPGGTPVESTTAAEKEQEKQRNIERGKLTRTVSGEKEVVIEIAALAGKGYPAPVGMDEGGGKQVPAKGQAPRRNRK